MQETLQFVVEDKIFAKRNEPSMKLLSDFAEDCGLTLQGQSIQGPNGYISQVLRAGTPMLVVSVLGGPALAFLHNSDMQSSKATASTGGIPAPRLRETTARGTSFGNPLAHTKSGEFRP